MRFRGVMLVVCLVLMIYSGASLTARPAPEWVCCNDLGDCNNVAGRCCDPESMGLPPCSPEAPGVCMTTCARIY